MKQIIWDKIKNCNSEERKKMPSYIESLIEIYYEVEQNGILGFQEFLNSNADTYEKIAIWFITSGYPPDLCSDIFIQILNSSYLSDELYLKYIIFSEYVLYFQKSGISVKELNLRLHSYLGIESMINLCC